MIEMNDDMRILMSFMHMPLNEAAAVMASWPTTVETVMDMDASQNGFLYIPGDNPSRVLLVAHADTVWAGTDAEVPHMQIINAGRIVSANLDQGIGADDRAGCAIAYLLQRLGHSVLITSGEERGQLGASLLAEKHPALLDTINTTHVFAVEFDRRGSGQFKCYDVGSDAFRRYVASETGLSEPDRQAYTDIGVVCTTMCGANISVGYHNEHTPDEYLDIQEWHDALSLSRKWLGTGGLPRFERATDNG